MRIKKTIAKISLFLALGMGLIKTPYAQANSNLARCFDTNTKFEILAHYEAEKSDYYLINIISTSIELTRNLIRVDNRENCFTVVDGNDIYDYPLSNFVDREIAYNLLTSRYLTLIEQSGGKEAFTKALLAELEADSPNIFFKDNIEVLEKLGVDLKLDIAPIVIVGEEGIPGHPQLQHLQ